MTLLPREQLREWAADHWATGRRAAGILRYLADPLDSQRAAAEVRARVVDRETAFLRLAEGSIFSNPRSPHRALLNRAGWDRTRLRESVHSCGVEVALGLLRDSGVYTTAAEFKCREPILREGLELRPRQRDFDNPTLEGRGLRAATSGTTAAPSRVTYDWSLFREEAALELLLFDSHGLTDVPCALWLPGLPGIAGLHNVLVHMLYRRPPERWFSQTPGSAVSAAVSRFVREAGRRYGMRVPMPELAAYQDAGRVARWLAATRDQAGSSVLKTFASSAVRVASSAERDGMDLSGCTIFAGGEPLTETSRARIESTGAAVYARYVATETGWIAGGCPRASSPDAMHLYSDRIAAIPGDGADLASSPLLLTTLTGASGKVLLNTDLGDAGVLRKRACACPLGRVGLDVEVAGVQGHGKVSVEGMTMSRDLLNAALDDAVASLGGSSATDGVVEEAVADGPARLMLMVGRNLDGASTAQLAERFLRRVQSSGATGRIAAQVWRESGAIVVRRRTPGSGRGHKTPATTVYFDPVTWADIYERPDPPAQAVVFRRGLSLARAACMADAERGDRWLDVGCGTGHLAADLARAGLCVRAFDHDPGMVSAARQRFTRILERGLQFEVADAAALPAADASQDGVVLTAVLGCVADPAPALAEAARVLRPGGTAIVTVTNRDSLLHTALGAARAVRSGPRPPGFTRARMFSAEDVRDLFAHAGLAITDIRPYNLFLGGAGRAFPPPQAASLLERLLSDRAAGRLARNLLVIGHRPRLQRTPEAVSGCGVG